VRDFEAIGAARHDAVLSPAEVDRVALLFADDGKPGERLGADRLVGFVDLIGKSGPVGGLASKLLAKPAFAVRALLLDKSARGNWALGWHQDRTTRWQSGSRRRAMVPGRSSAASFTSSRRNR